MKFSIALIILVLWANSSSAGKVKKESKGYDSFNYDKGYEASYSFDKGYGLGKYGGGYGEYKEGHSGKSYNSGSGLRHIAQGSADQANSAVASQYSAAGQAAYAAKKTLAQKASQAAATAMAALHGKEVLLTLLEHETAEAQKNLQDELGQLLLAKKASQASQQASQQAHYHVDVLSAALNNAKLTAQQIGGASSDSAAEYASQSAMVGHAKNRLDQLKEKLESARSDYIATREAADKAALSAAEAHKNAQESAKYAHGSYYGYGEGEYASEHKYEHGYDGGELYGEHHSYEVHPEY